jgi:hypothetical protein
MTISPEHLLVNNFGVFEKDASIYQLINNNLVSSENIIIPGGIEITKCFIEEFVASHSHKSLLDFFNSTIDNQQLFACVNGKLVNIPVGEVW